MVFKRKKLLNRLLIITLCTTLIPLIVAGLYLIPKTNVEFENAIKDKIASQTLILSHFLEDHVLFPLQYFFQDLAANPQYLTDIQFNSILSEHTNVKEHLIFLSEVYLNQTYRVWYVNKESSGEDVTIINKELISEILSDSMFVYKTSVINMDSLEYLEVTFKSKLNSVFVAQIDISHLFDLLKNFANGQNINSNFGIYDRENKKALFSNLTVDLSNSENLQGEKIGKGKNGSFLNYFDTHSFIKWRIYTEISKDRTAKSKRNLWLNFTLILFFGFVLSLLGTTYYLKKITGPLDRFARSATEIARGNFDQRIRLESDDEIGRLARIFNYMTIELRRLNNMNLNRIITERTKTKTIIKNIGDGIIVTDENDRIVTVNVAVENWFGVQEDEVVDKPIRDVIKEKELLNLIEDIKETDLEGTFTRDLLTITDRAKDKIFQARATKLLNQENKFMGVVAILRDITQEKEIDRMKTELVSMVAHELRSPLTSISGFAELLLSPDESRKSIHEYANVIHVEAGRLADLVNKFLDISKIEAGRMDYKPANLKIKQITNSIFHVAVVQAQKKNIKLSLLVDDENAEIFADEKMISEVILNLLSNAIKYSPERTQVKLQIETNNSFTNIQVSDQGFGISEKHLPNIFRKFYRIKDDPRIQEERGTGLGLTLVKEIVELHNGRITVESQVGKGTIVNIKIPRAPSSSGWQQ